ncbi:Fic family protein [Bacteroidota bacterium]
MIAFDRTKPFNQLPLLPPEGNVIDEGVLLEWGYASRNLAELNKNILRLPNPTMLINTITLQEAKSSSEIENIFTTEDELYKAVSETINEDKISPNTKEVLRYREALWAGHNNVKENGEISLDSILKIYQKIKNTNQLFRPPQSQVVIRRGNSDFRSGEIIYTPPRGEIILKTLLKNLVDYYSKISHKQPDFLIKMAISHYQFEAIHPFSDRNGRTGRILNILFLVHVGLISQPVLYLSKYIIENKDDYYYRLAAVTQRADWKQWLIFIMKAVQHTSSYTNRLIDEIVSQMDATLKYGKEKLKWYTKEVNEAIFNQPYIKQATIGKVLNRTSRTTLTKYMQDLSKLGILSPKKDGKEVYYLNNDLIRILES